jgi:Na+/proline symporter
MGIDFILCFIATILDSAYSNTSFSDFIINFLIFFPMQVSVVILLYLKRKKYCIAGGFLYLIGGIIVWLYKMIFFIYLLLSEKLETDYEIAYSESIFIVSFLMNLLTIFIRLGVCYLIKNMFSDVCVLEEYIHEKEHAEFIQSLGTKAEEKLCEDDEITEDKLYAQNQNNPFITGRKKGDEKEEEEVNFQTTL